MTNKPQASPSPPAARDPGGEAAPRIIAIDWSGSAHGAAKKIWLAEAAGGALVRLERNRSRDEIATHLSALATEERSLVVGIDFAFSMPAWYVAAAGCADAPALWARMAAGQGERLLADCEPPFWGRPGRPRPQIDGDALRLTDRRLLCAGPDGQQREVAAKSVFQIGGAGAVGTGSIRGMKTLHLLREAGFAIWPFDDPRLPVVIEIYPRLFTGTMNKSDPAARLTRLARERQRIPPPLLEAAHRSDDAFDAAISALAMWDGRAELLSLPPVRDQQTRIEGAIWYRGVRSSNVK